MPAHTELLQKIGLTKAEADVYLALLELGETTVTPIKNRIKMHPSKLYEYLNSLIKKGLIGYVVKNNTKYFNAKSPESLLAFVDKKQAELAELKNKTTKLVSELKKIKIPEKKLTLNFYEGADGIERMYKELYYAMKNNSSHYALAAPETGLVDLQKLYSKFAKKRAEKEISFKAVFNNEAKEFSKIISKFGKTYYLPELIVIPHWVEVFDNNIAVFFISKNISAIVISDTKISEQYISYFELIKDKATEN